MYSSYNQHAQMTAVNTNLPFIPPPDYSMTVKPQYPASRRPQLSLPLNQHPKEPKLRLSEHHQLTVYTDLLNNDHIVDLSNGQILASPNGVSIAEVDPNSLSPEEKKEQTKQRVFKMLQAQGIPVFPGLGQLKKPTQKEAAPLNPHLPPGLEQHAHLGPTRAYIKHLENHRKFDTMKNFDSCDKCPICRQMLSEIDMLAAQPKQPKPVHKSTSLITSGKAFEPLTILEENEPEEDADAVAPSDRSRGYVYVGNGPSTSSHSSYKEQNQQPRQVVNETDDLQTARAREDWTAQGHKQLSVKYGETLKVSRMGQDWIYCRNKLGQTGWVPSNQLYLMPGGYY